MSTAAPPPRRAGGDPGPPRGADETVWQQVQASEQFVELRRRFRSFVFPVTALFLVWYFLYVLLAAFAPGFMGTEVLGNINVGLVFGLLQFVSTFAITMLYRRWADRRFDPGAEALRTRVEDGLEGSAR